VTRTEHDGSITVLIDSYQGKKLNAPNDLVVHSDGAIWFTDPGYGIMSNYEGHKAAFELPTAVYRLDAITHEITVVASDMDKPNGLCFSPDEKLLYIVDSGNPKHPGDPRPIRVYDVMDGMRLKNGRMFVNMSPGSSDGIRCDVDGNVWSAAGWGGSGYNGVHVFAPDATLIGKIHLPETCANLCFGGAKKNRLWPPVSHFIPCTSKPKAHSCPSCGIYAKHSLDFADRPPVPALNCLPKEPTWAGIQLRPKVFSCSTSDTPTRRPQNDLEPNGRVPLPLKP
jgi:sugar lactone lactonase YvrE